jgi:predicted ester cyclase
MGSNIDIVKAWAGVPTGDVEESAKYLAENFQNVDKDGTVLMDKQGWMNMFNMLLASFPDWEYVRSDIQGEGDYVIQTGHFEGTHEVDLDLSALGAGVFPASGRKIIWPDATTRVTVKGGKIEKIEPIGDGGGLKAFIETLAG